MEKIKQLETENWHSDGHAINDVTIKLKEVIDVVNKIISDDTEKSN